MQGIPPVNISSAAAQIAATQPNSADQVESGSTNLFGHLVKQVNQDQQVSDQAIQNFIEQKPGANVQQVVMAVAKADMSFQFLMEIRNHLIDSYNELMRMQF